jgi:molybdenum cofactor guanylyltransferase
MDRIPGVGGIVLCGGRSSRMGRPKAWLPFGPEVLLQRVVRVLGEVIEPMVVVAAPGQEVPSLPPGVLVARDQREYLGPLNGLAAGLAVLDDRVDSVYLSSCDVPFLVPGFVRHIVSGLKSCDVCLPEVGGFKHPLAAAYRLTVRSVVTELLAAGQLRLVHLTERLPTCVLGETNFAEVDPQLRSLRNVNTPDDYEHAIRELGYPPAAPA